MFSTEIRFREHTPEDQIRQLRNSGLSLAEVAEQTDTSVAVVRRIVGKVDNVGIRRQQEEIAKRIEAEGGSWNEKVAKWKAKTGRCAVTFWRLNQEMKRATAGETLAVQQAPPLPLTEQESEQEDGSDQGE